MFKTTKSVGMLSLARFWLYGSRDLWFEIAAPIFLSQALGWNPAIVSGMMGAYTVVYGKLQAASNALCLGPLRCTPPRPSHVLPWTIILGIIESDTSIPSKSEDSTIRSPQISLQVFLRFCIFIFAFIFSNTSNRPILVLFSPTFLIKTLDFLEINAATIMKAAEEKSPTTSYEEISDKFDL